MSAAELDKITNAALSLSEQDRAKLASDLVSSLDGPADINAEDAWNEEIYKRIKDIKAGKSELLDAEDAIAQVQEHLRN